jgi:transposase
VEAQAYIRALEARVRALEAAVRRTEATVQHLTGRLQQDSRTSSWPPSSDPPQAIGKRPRRGPSGRRPGGQPGHEGQARALLPVEAVDMMISLKPVVTEYRPHRLVCPACGGATWAEVPAGVPAGGFGPRAQAIAALCAGAYHRSKHTTQSVLEDLFGMALSLGTLANLQQATVQAMAEPVAAARAYV